MNAEGLKEVMAEFYLKHNYCSFLAEQTISQYFLPQQRTITTNTGYLNNEIHNNIQKLTIH
jgi:hypothetical protein